MVQIGFQRRDTLSSGRSRAKSVSPGLMLASNADSTKGQPFREKSHLRHHDGLSASSKNLQAADGEQQLERLSKRGLPRAIDNGATSAVTGTHSYSDLGAAVQCDNNSSPGERSPKSDTLLIREGAGSDTVSDPNLMNSLRDEGRLSGLSASRNSSPVSQKSACCLTTLNFSNDNADMAESEADNKNCESNHDDNKQRGSLQSFEMSTTKGQNLAIAASRLATTTTATASTTVKRDRNRSSTAASRLTVNSALSSSVHHQLPEETFVRLVGSAAHRLLAELKSQLPTIYDEQTDELLSIVQSLNDDDNNRIYHLELIELSSQVTFILLIPSAENVCPVTSHEKSNILANNLEYMLLPLQIFETIHISTYEPDLLGKYSRLSAILETDLIVAQHDYRQAFSSNELKSTKHRVSRLQDMVSIADEFWRQLRWIVDVVSFARDKSVVAASGGIKLGTIRRHFELSPSCSYEHSNNWMSGQGFKKSAAAAAVASTEPIGGGVLPPGQVSRVQEEQTARSGREIKRTTSARESCDIAMTGSRTADETNRRHQPLAKAESSRQTTALIGSSKPTTATTTSQLASVGRQQSSQRRHSDDEHQSNSRASNAYQAPGSGKGAMIEQQIKPIISSTLSKYCRSEFDNHDHDIDIDAAGEDDDDTELQKADMIRCTIHRRNNNNNESNQTERAPDATITNDCPQIMTYNLNDRNPEESVLDIRLRDASEDEESIYAYHISLKDATRAAVERKNSQHSNRAVAGEELIPASQIPIAAMSTVRTTTRTNNDDNVSQPTTLPVDWCDMLELKHRIAQEKRFKVIETGESSAREVGQREPSNLLMAQQQQCAEQTTKAPSESKRSSLGNYTQLDGNSQSSTWLPDVAIITTGDAQSDQGDKKNPKKEEKKTSEIDKSFSKRL
ncbi:hypothetical protein SUGI_1488640 [Cryptomeria japonica]|uniref:Uncharacterized protein n=1 Tax=Cryptomeria japonica TaxID=3369 RepID=A0AAD3NVP9_CRYJA|nr:hypothetical protein SUGI_1488640 [Cryptomeria japonica]